VTKTKQTRPDIDPIYKTPISHHLLLGGLDGSLGDLTSTLVSLDDRLDDTDSDGLSHITNSKTTERRVFSESLNTHGLGRNHLDDGSITRLDELWSLFNRLTSTPVDLLDELGELASNVGSVAVKNWSITVSDLTRVVHQDDLGIEGFSTLWWVVLGVTGNVSTTDFLDGDVLDVETNVVTRETLSELLVVHLNGLDFSGHTGWSKGNNHTGLDDTGFNTADWHSSDTTNLVDVLEWETEGLIRWTAWGLNGINGFQESLASVGTSLSLFVPSLVPWAVGRVVDHVVTVETRDRNEWNGLGVESDLLDEVGGFFDDFMVTSLRPLGCVHLVDGNDELLDTEGVGKKCVLTSLTILGDTSFKLTSTSGNDEDSTIGLGSTSDHVLDEVTMARGINDGDIVLGGLELPESDVDGDTTFTLSLQFVQHPSVLEGTLSEFSSFLFELLNGTLVDTTALVDQVTGGGRLTRVDVSDDDEVNVGLFLSHFYLY